MWPLSQRGWLDGLTLRRGGGVSRALMFPRQETPSPSCTLYLSACSPIFIRLYLRLESVPLHFLLRSSSSSSRRHRFHPPSLPLPSRHSTFSPPGTDAVTTTCKHSGICNSNAAKRGREAATEQPEVVRLTSRRRSRDYKLAILLIHARIRAAAEIIYCYFDKGTCVIM